MVARYEFKAVRPTFDINPFWVCGEPQADGKTRAAVGAGPRRLADHGRHRRIALTETAMRPLTGITVVTLEHAIAAPFATRQLADLGARVIKIERPGVGDFARGYDERVRGLASHFVWTNRSKESLTLDVKHPEAQAMLKRLVLEHADVVVQNLAPGAAARLGLSYEALSAEKPAHHRLRHLRLRRRRPVSRQEGVRPADPERSRLRIDDRHARHAVEGRPVDRRHRGGHPHH